METPITHPAIVEQIKRYAEVQLKLIKLKVIGKTISIIAEIFADLMVALWFVFTLFWLNITIALFAGQLLGSTREGFALVSIFDVAIVIAVKIIKINFKNLFTKLFIQRVFRQTKK
jgi:hypothetical protein